MVSKFFDKKSTVSGTKNDIKQNKQFANELHKLVIENSKKEKVIHHLETISGAQI